VELHVDRRQRQRGAALANGQKLLVYELGPDWVAKVASKFAAYQITASGSRPYRDTG
jgi:hypothetical protein